MAKKVKCIECNNGINWAIPGIDVLKESHSTIERLKNTIVCECTMKTKMVDNCQYCKNYKPKNEIRKKRREQWEHELKEVLTELS